MEHPAAIFRESLLRRWGRRWITISLVFFLWVTFVALAPFWIVTTAVVGPFQRNRWAWLRFMALMTVYATCEVLGMLAAFALWLRVGGPFARRSTWSSRDVLERHWQVQSWWSDTLFGAFCKLYGVELEIEGQDEANCDVGPLLVFVRHASVADTLVPSNFIVNVSSMRLRYVLKRELLWDPCLDVFGQRLPNYFVDRETHNTSGEVDAIKALARDLGPQDGVVIFPEGTRFTQRKRARIIERAREKGNTALMERASRLENMLPPRMGGTLGLLESNTGADALFVGHTGFEPVNHLSNLVHGELIGARIRVGFWRVPAAEIPAREDEQVLWFHQQWKRIDQWIDHHKADPRDAEPVPQLAEAQ